MTSKVPVSEASFALQDCIHMRCVQ